ncbi:MAG: hypothetical protein ABIK09_01500 [Pseudomonadota bacterium]
MRRAAVALFSVLLLGACSGPTTREGDPLEGVGKPKIPLWVEIAECKKGRPVVRDFSVLKMPDEKLFWAISYRDKSCHIYGAILKEGDSRAPGDCDVRFRSKEPLPKAGKRCSCVAGRYDLQEGRSTAEKCCARYPDSVHCREKLPAPDVEPLPEPEPEPPDAD